MTTQEELLKDITDRVAAQVGEKLEATLGEARIKEIVKTSLAELDDNDPVVRKMRFGSGDQRLVGSKFSRHNLTQADIEFMYDILNSHRGNPRKGGGTYQGPSEALEKAFKDVSEAYYLSDDEVRATDKQAIDDLFPRVPRPEVLANYRNSHASIRSARQAAMTAWNAAEARAATMDTTQSGFGQQLVGAQYVGDLWDAAFQDGRIAPLFNTFEMTAPSAYLPVAVDFPEMMYVSESTSDVIATAQYGTVRTGSQRVQVDAKKFLFHQVWSGEMEEDAIIPYIPFLRRQLSRALAFYTDALLLNGDTTNAGTGNINSDDADPTDTKYFLALDGIRHAAIVDNTANYKDVGGTLDLTLFRDLKNLMRDETRFVDWGDPNDPNDLVFACDPSTAQNAALLDDVLAAKIMLGDRAGLLRGQITSILGHPVIGTMAIPKTDSDGKYTTTTPTTNDTKGQLVAFNRGGGTIGWRRRIRLETERIPGSDQTRLVASLRLGFGRYTPSGSASGQEWVAVGGNITL